MFRRYAFLLRDSAPFLRGPPCHARPPDYAASLVWVYGLKASGTRRCVGYTHLGELGYIAGSVGVLFIRERNSQAHLVGHAADIMCIAFHTSVRDAGLRAVVCAGGWGVGLTCPSRLVVPVSPGGRTRGAHVAGAPAPLSDADADVVLPSVEPALALPLRRRVN